LLELVIEPLLLPLFALLFVFSEELVMAVVSAVFDALVPLVPLTLVVLPAVFVLKLLLLFVVPLAVVP
jgi:hypothetical protein